MLHPEFSHANADDTIYHACELIVKRKLRYLPIVDPEQVLMLSVLSQLDILGETPSSQSGSLDRKGSVEVCIKGGSCLQSAWGSHV